jgi:iron(III) transport system ATP-binding protein
MISVRSLSKCFGETKALSGVTFDVAQGERLALLGPSGSGKTTLLRLIAGLDLPDSGEILIAGRLVSDPGRALAPHLRGVGFVFQRTTLWPHMTVAANIRYGLEGLPREEVRRRVGALLEDLFIAGLEGRYPAQLSGGEARRVELARALAPRPSLLLMDEPLTNLDEALKSRLLELIISAVEAVGSTLLYVTHEAGESRRISHRVLRLEEGRIVP